MSSAWVNQFQTSESLHGSSVEQSKQFNIEVNRLWAHNKYIIRLTSIELIRCITKGLITSLREAKNPGTFSLDA